MAELQQEIVNTVSAEVKAETAEKREREQTEETEDGCESKKQKVGEEEKSNVPVKVGPKEFVSSMAMFDYFTKFMHFWPTDLDVNKVCLTVLFGFVVVKFQFLCIGFCDLFGKSVPLQLLLLLLF